MSATATATRTVQTPRPSEIEARARREAWTRRLPLLPAMVLMIIVTQIPFLLTLFYSLFSWNLAKPGSPYCLTRLT